MSYPNRYTGTACVVIFNGTTISADYTDINLDYTIRVEEKTAGNDTDKSINPTIKEGKANMKRYSVGTSDTVDALLKIGTIGTLEVRPQGTGTGLPVESFQAVLTDLKKAVIFNKNVLHDISWEKNGPMIKDVGSVQ